MNDQKQLWDNAHQNGKLSNYSSVPSSFAEDVLKLIKPQSKILELGCGVGNDFIAFANAGHKTIATDFSNIAIGKNSERFGNNSNLAFKVVDIAEPFIFDDNDFDVVYARLSLHYFTDKTTKKIFQEIYRVLKPEGLLCFICKSTDDPLYGKGERIEDDMFELDGHVRHFFSEEYVKACLRDNFQIEKLETGKEEFYGSESGFIKVIAKAIK